MIPLNSHIQIEPEKHDDFIASATETYNEIGKVIAISYELQLLALFPLQVGDRVYFDSWTASKFPAGEGKYYWLVPFENIKAYESSLPKVDVQERIFAQLQDTFATEGGTTGTVSEVRTDDVLPERDTELEVPPISRETGTASERPDVSKGVSGRS